MRTYRTWAFVEEPSQVCWARAVVIETVDQFVPSGDTCSVMLSISVKRYVHLTPESWRVPPRSNVTMALVGTPARKVYQWVERLPSYALLASVLGTELELDAIGSFVPLKVGLEPGGTRKSGVGVGTTGLFTVKFTVSCRRLVTPVTITA
jgi:hypothetical protein